MYITGLKLENIKCFKKLEYSFENEDGASLVIAGDNGDGKSTILRSIALSLCDKWTAAGLLRELSGEFVRSNNDIEKGVITLDLQNGKSKYVIKTTIKWNKNETYEYPIRNIAEYKNGKKVGTIPDEEFPWKDIFATGYGAGLRTSGTQDFQYYFTGDSIYSLFKSDVSLQNPELAVRRITESIRENELKGIDVANEVKESILAWLGEILLLKDQYLEIKPNGIYIFHTKTKTSTALAASGDGYKALTALVLDMLAWWFLNQFYDAEKGRLRKDKVISIEGLQGINGIVIIDELEQHLHPKWQKEILPALKKNFPNVQFVIATHSPLVISGAKTPILILNECNGISKEFFGWRAEDVYREMGVKNTSRSDDMIQKLGKFDSLYAKKIDGQISSPESDELKVLEQELLRDLPETDPAVEVIKMMTIKNYINLNEKYKKNK